MSNEKSNYTNEKLVDLETSLSDAKAKVKKDIKSIRSFYFIVCLFTLFLFFHYVQLFLLPNWVLVLVWILNVLFVLAALGTDTEKSNIEVEKFESIKRIYLGFPEPSENKVEYFDSLVKINVTNLDSYYTLVKRHTSQSFRASLLISIIGFVLIAIGLIIGFNNNNKDIGYISIGSGIITEFISGVLFYLYNKTVRQLKDYHDSLVNVQNVLLSFKLIESTNDEKVKAEMVSKMLEYLVQKRPI